MSAVISMMCSWLDRLSSAVSHISASVSPQGPYVGGVRVVEVHLVRVHGQQGEPGVVGLADRTAQWVPVDVADLEILEEPPCHPGLTVTEHLRSMRASVNL
jgi:hypothetical protein